ncbi:MAG: putative toxin-antitoxin system toxin component, PIN family [Gammaproteobacteria bacterium]|nr:MAG: putative toxin-antitoxin system toxin component, PIN family [Gammaproteobacteria bacterium]
MEPTNVVLDTNVLIAALKSRRGASHKLLINIDKGLYVPNISVPLFFEYESVAKRIGIVSGLAKKDINAILDFILSKSNIREIFYLWRPYLKDPKNDLLLEVAVESQSEYILTFNKKDFAGIDRFGIQVATPQEFMNKRGF